MSASQVLSAAAALINTQAKWCQKTCAIDTNGHFVGALNSNAVKYDLFGSIQRATHNLGLPLSDFHQAYAILKSLIPANVKNKDIEGYNDTSTYAVIYAMLNTAMIDQNNIITNAGDHIVTNLGDYILFS